MDSLAGQRIPPLGGDNSVEIPGHSMMSQNGQFRLGQLPGLKSPTKKRSRSGSRSIRTSSQGSTKSSSKISRLRNIEKTVEDVMVTCLHDVEYDPTTCISLSQSLAGAIMEKIKPFACGRYKMVAVASIGNLKEQAGMQFGSRCLWNKQSDSFLSIKYANRSLFAVAMVYCLLYE